MSGRGAAAEEGALPPLDDEQRTALPGRVRGYVWPTEFLMLADVVSASPHRHSALQVMVGIEAPIRIDVGGGWQEVPGVLVDTDVEHAFDGTLGLMGGGWVESESRTGNRLRQRVLDGAGWTPLDEEVAASVGAELAPCLRRETGCATAHRHWRAAIAVLLDEPPRDPVLDDRIAAVLEHLRSTPTPPPSVGALGEVAHLSPSRLQHLFSDQVGVPIRRYLLWQRMLTAMARLAEGTTATEAAHAAGFADAAHLTRTTRRMTGVTPSEMQPLSAWLSNCR